MVLFKSEMCILDIGKGKQKRVKFISTSIILNRIPLCTYESDLYANASNLWAVGWSEVPLQLLVLLQMNKALSLGLLLLDLLGNCLQFLWVQLCIQ